MARQKKTSVIIKNANTRASALASIDANLDLGNGLTLAGYNTAIAASEAKLADYNTKLSGVDAALNVFQSSEGDLADLSDRMLAGVGSKFGKDSDQYEQAGGTKKSERAKSVKKKNSSPAK
jgi:hypothetical protein